MCELGDKNGLYPVVECFETNNGRSHALHDANVGTRVVFQEKRSRTNEQIKKKIELTMLDDDAYIAGMSL